MKTITIAIEVSDSEHAELCELADRKDLELESYLADILTEQLGICG